MDAPQDAMANSMIRSLTYIRRPSRSITDLRHDVIRSSLSIQSLGFNNPVALSECSKDGSPFIHQLLQTQLLLKDLSLKLAIFNQTGLKA